MYNCVKLVVSLVVSNFGLVYALLNYTSTETWESNSTFQSCLKLCETVLLEPGILLVDPNSVINCLSH